MRSADAVRRETLEQMLGGEVPDTGAAGARLGYDLRRWHTAFVVWGDTEDADVESSAAAVGGPNTLLVPLGTGMVAGWAPGPVAAPDGAEPGSRAAIGAPGEGLDGFRRSHAEALEARRVARLSGLSSPVRYDDIALVALLTKDADQAERFARAVLGELIGGGDATRKLSLTVLTVLELQGSPRRAAQRLGVHENTVAKRIRSAEALLGWPIDERPSELLAALTIAQALDAG